MDREIKRNNDILTKRNKQLHNSVLEMRGVYVLLKRRNIRLTKDNTKIYRMIILMRLQNKNANPSPQTQLALETLAEAVTSFQDPEVAHDVSNIMKVEELLEVQE